ncbi:MAG TPA: hypothetical protein VH560_01245 [Polyangia bacterium]|jgi:hypothetical protein|nr:hypothetical protein [Polyangia bacterium]
MYISRGFDPNDGDYVAIFDTSGQPTNVWRVSTHAMPSGGSDYCQMRGAILTPSRVWFGANAEGEHPIRAYYVDAPLADIGSMAAPIAEMHDSQLNTASDDAMALQQVGGIVTMVYDRVDGTTDVLGGASGPTLNIPMAYPVNQSAIFVQAPDLIHWQGAIWNHATHATEPLIVPPAGQAVLSLRSDGQTLVWWQAPVSTDGEGINPAGDLWVAPFATSKSGVVARKLRTGGPQVSVDQGVAGSGYYAVLGRDNNVHVYRLSDGHHWAFAPPPPIYEFYYVDETYVVLATTDGIIRQEIAALGAGD